MLGLSVAWAADAQPALDARLGRLAEAAGLSDDQRPLLDAVAARYSDANRADLWAAAAEVHALLTDDQIARLRETVEARRGDRRADRPGRDGRRADRGRRGGERRADRARPTDEQRRARREVRADLREQRQALTQRLRDGSISDDAFVAEMGALRERAEARRDALRSDAAAPDRRARREAVQDARDRALGLTDAQTARLQTLRLDRIRQSPGPLDVRPFLDADGRLDRAAFRHAQRERRQAAREVRQSQREAAEAVLTDDQREVVALHRALAGGRGGRGRR